MEVREIEDIEAYERGREEGLSQSWEAGNMDYEDTGIRPLRLKIEQFSVQVKERQYKNINELYLNLVHSKYPFIKEDLEVLKEGLKKVSSHYMPIIITIDLPNKVEGVDMFKGYINTIDLMNINITKKRRQNIRRAIKAGVKIREATEEDIPFLIDISKEFAKMKNINDNVSSDRIRYAFISPICKTFCIVLDEEIIGFEIVMIDKKSKTTCSASGAWSEEAYKVNGHSLLKYEILMWSLKNGYKNFDIGSILPSSQLANIGHFKESFGGKTTPYYTYRELCVFGFGINLKPFAKFLKIRQSEE